MTMQSFDDLLREILENELNNDKEEKGSGQTPAEKAAEQGLHHVGYGQFANKQGDVVAKSREGELVPVSGDDDTDSDKDTDPLPKPDSYPDKKDPQGGEPGSDEEPAPEDPRVDLQKASGPPQKQGIINKVIDKAIGTQFKKRVQIAPGVKINMRRGKFGYSIGGTGLQITKGPQGAYLHMGIPGTGLYRKVDLKDIAKSLQRQKGKQTVQFRRRINLGGGNFLNVSRSGLGFKFGTKGLSVTSGPNGTMGHVGIPGTGVFKKFKIL